MSNKQLSLCVCVPQDKDNYNANNKEKKKFFNCSKGILTLGTAALY